MLENSSCLIGIGIRRSYLWSGVLLVCEAYNSKLCMSTKLDMKGWQTLEPDLANSISEVSRKTSPNPTLDKLQPVTKSNLDSSSFAKAVQTPEWHKVHCEILSGSTWYFRVLPGRKFVYHTFPYLWVGGVRTEIGNKRHITCGPSHTSIITYLGTVRNASIDSSPRFEALSPTWKPKILQNVR